MRSVSILRSVSGVSGWSARVASASVALIASVALVALSGCLQATPFGADPESRDLTAKNVAALAERPEPSGPFKIAALGDTHDDYDRFAKAVELINARGDIDLVLHAGGMSDRGLLKELEWTTEILGRLRMPFFAAIGNHDAISEGKAIYKTMFGPYDFSFAWGSTKFVVFNSNTLEFPETAPNRDWITEALADRGDAKHLVVLTHQAPGAPDDIPGGTSKEVYKDLLATADIDVYIHGHVPEFSLLIPSGRTAVLSLGAFEEAPYYMVLTVDPERRDIAYERCDLETCKDVVLVSAQ